MKNENGREQKYDILSPMDITLEDIFSFLRENALFARLSDEELMAAADLVEVFIVEAGEVLYRPGDTPDGLYFVYRGRVRVSAPTTKGGLHRSLTYGDIFGEEVLVYGQDRLTQAAVRSEAVVFRVTPNGLAAWVDEFPALLTPLRLAQESFYLTYDREFSWLAKGEKVKFACRLTKFVLWRSLAAPGILTAGLLAFIIYLLITGYTFWIFIPALLLLPVLPWVAWLVADWKNDFLVITNRRIVNLEKVLLLYETRHETPLEAVQSLSVDTDQWGRLFGYGSIQVHSFTASQPLKLIQHPAEVMNIMDEVLDRVKSRRQEEEKRTAEAIVRSRLGMEPEEGDEALLAARTEFEAGAVPASLSSFFHMRVEEGGTITYRTHWIKLFQSAFLSTLVLILVPALLVTGLVMEIPVVSSNWVSLAAAVLWFAALGLWIYRYLDWHNDCYIITPDTVMDVNHKPFGQEESRTAPLSSILGIEYTRKGLLGLLFNYGTVHIKIGDSDFTFDDVYDPSAVQQELFQKLNEFGLRQKKAAAEEERQRMADFIETYHHLYKGRLAPQDGSPEGG